MIGDATVEVTCDYEGCYESVSVPLEMRFRSYQDETGYYDSSDSSIEESLEDLDEGWAVINGQHFCELHSQFS